MHRAMNTGFVYFGFVFGYDTRRNSAILLVSAKGNTIGQR